MSERVDGNLVKPRGSGVERLFFSSAFVIGFSDYHAGRAFKYPENARGPNGHKRSAEIAYERGRQFSAIWGARSIWDKRAMMDELDRLHAERVIL